MGYETNYYGKLEFTRELTREELSALDKIINAALFRDPEIFDATKRQAEATRAIERDGKGALVFDPCEGADLRAGFLNLITGEHLSPHDATSLRISADGSGLEYCSEKTYDMIGGVNFIIANGRERIPGFGLKGSLYASTEFEPYTWLVEINKQGWAEQVPCKMEDLPPDDQQKYKDEIEAQRQAWKARCERMRNEHTGFRSAMKGICDRVRFNAFLLRERCETFLTRKLHL